MKESDVRGKAGDERERGLPAPEQDGAPGAPEPPKRETDDEWLAFASEDPAFFIKPADAV
jgi:hypothetical protein